MGVCFDARAIVGNVCKYLVYLVRNSDAYSRSVVFGQYSMEYEYDDVDESLSSLGIIKIVIHISHNVTNDEFFDFQFHVNVDFGLKLYYDKTHGIEMYSNYDRTKFKDKSDFNYRFKSNILICIDEISNKIDAETFKMLCTDSYLSKDCKDVIFNEIDSINLEVMSTKDRKLFLAHLHSMCNSNLRVKVLEFNFAFVFYYMYSEEIKELLNILSCLTEILKDTEISVHLYFGSDITENLKLCLNMLYGEQCKRYDLDTSNVSLYVHTSLDNQNRSNFYFENHKFIHRMGQRYKKSIVLQSSSTIY
jgi:hypothetical protein